ncbi:PREDICTED: intraflagellar transport protein 46 homolog [Vollenhovia emeryi]|uniref:intraflagellar transport protein 46 homolog n=1 Tax=Vollenhovia emeryi TaxID=411798 RepID=UPI0005F400F9|nr:PREDICTED: intraflagellar transport protein 46 homolog [Vollenhovia emeryi]XP_011876486.1 PREDICTED: intraflagellar transport protein 46 homolog [Vollenhovia emeryi]XP_011876487.1 PREDICTED: intraflagellar transport protein 46 homolog [Vollenhovia emeryi]
MDIKDSSEEEDERTHDIPAFGKFDEAIVVRNAEEIKSPVSHRPASSKRTRRSMASDSTSTFASNSPRGGKHDFRRYSGNDVGFEKSLGLGSDPSDSEETDDDDIQGSSVAKPIDLYDPKEFENLEASTEVKELFQNIIRYTPQRLELNYKLIPFVPDYIPAVGDIDAFIKVPRPDGVEDKIGLTVLDEPCTDQSDPAVLHLQLRNHSRSAGAAARQAVVKRIEDAERNGKSIDKWIDDMNQLHRSKHPPGVQLSRAMPDIDGLMQQWPAQVEDRLNELQLDLSELDCDLPQLIDVACNLLDIPTRESRLEALHTLFTLYLEIRNVDSHNFS